MMRHTFRTKLETLLQHRDGQPFLLGHLAAFVDSGVLLVLTPAEKLERGWSWKALAYREA